MGGTRLKVHFLHEDTIIHSPECFSQGNHPITEEKCKYLSHQGNLGGVVRLQSIDKPADWADTKISQEFANTMFDKLQDLLNAAYNCTRHNIPQTPQVQEVIKIAQDIQDEFASRITRPNTWELGEHEDNEPDQNNSKDDPTHEICTNLAGYLGTQYYVNLRKPRSENELRVLMHQLEGLGQHFDEIALPLRTLRPHTDVPRSSVTGRWQTDEGDRKK